MLELRNITKDYEAGGEKVRALKGVTLAFRQNEFVSILGQSGCGKTTMLNIVGGLDRYTDGDLIIDGRSTKYFKAADWDAYRNRRIGFVFQSYNLIPHLTVLGNVELALTLSGVKKDERRRRAIEALKRVGLENEIKKRPNQMSGGQMQRVAIARAIVNDPEIILADEPTGALDSATSVQVMEILKEIAADRLVIMVTHNRTLAETYSTRIVSMLDGKVIDDTSPFIVETSDSEAVYVDDAATAASEETSSDGAAKEETAGAEEVVEEEADNDTVDAEENIAAEADKPQDTAAAENKKSDAEKAREDKAAKKARKKEQKEITKSNKAAMKRTSMSFWTAFGLSARNLITKKGRTIATAIAGSIGIIGVALVLALSNGFNMYIEDMQTSMLANYPVTTTRVTMDMDAMMENMESGAAKIEQFPDGKKIIVKDQTLAAFHYNRITPEFLKHIESMPDGLAIDMTYAYAKVQRVAYKTTGATGVKFGFVPTSSSNFSSMLGMGGSVFQQLLNNSEYVKSQYDVLAGSYPSSTVMTDSATGEKYVEVALVIGTDNTLNRSTLDSLGIAVPAKTGKNAEIDFSDIIYNAAKGTGQTYKLISNDNWYGAPDENGYYSELGTKNMTQEVYDAQGNLSLRVSGVMRIKETAMLAIFSSGLVYPSALNEWMISDAMESDVGKAQAEEVAKGKDGKVITDTMLIDLNSQLRIGGYKSDTEKLELIPAVGRTFGEIVKEDTISLLSMLGVNMKWEDIAEMAIDCVGGRDIPVGVSYYPVTFEKKSAMINYIKKYNKGLTEDDKIYIMDASSIVTSTVSDMIDIISYVLIAFAAISLVVSSVMISIITYASVVERTKEIGVLRAVGARKKDIMRVFNAETIIIGLAAGIVGVLFTFIVSFPLSALFVNISEGVITVNLVSLAWWHALMLIAISALLTFIAGLIPAYSASKRDPVKALRSE